MIGPLPVFTGPESWNAIAAAMGRRQIRCRLPKTEVLIFTVHEDEALVAELLRAGGAATS